MAGEEERGEGGREMTAKERIRAESRIRKRRSGDGYRVEGDIPSVVRDRLGAGPDDVLVFEEGNAFVAERAAVPGPYFVVTLRRGRGPAAPPPPAPEPDAETGTPTPASSALTESLEETILRLRRERQ